MPEPNRLDLTALSAQTAAAAASPPVDPVTTQNMQERKQSFVARAADRNVDGSGSLQTPRSPYQVMAGTIIPAALATGINSDLPGQIIGSVTENVYDITTGRHLLIPQGARLIGQYDSGGAFGQSRVLLVWSRIIIPGVDTAGPARLEAGSLNGAFDRCIAARMACMVVALPWSIWPVIPPGMRSQIDGFHRTPGLNT